MIRSVPSASEPDSARTKPIQIDCGKSVGKGEIEKKHFASRESMCANGTAGRRETRCAKNPRDIERGE